jgi:5-(carboxyamino)imidazole ribonucleotide mutase
VLVVMGSRSDWSTMRHADALLRTLGVDHGCAIVSAHRTPERLADVGAAGGGAARG